MSQSQLVSFQLNSYSVTQQLVDPRADESIVYRAGGGGTELQSASV